MPKEDKAMAKALDLSLEDEEQLCNLGAALSSPARLQILKLLYFNSYSVSEIADGFFSHGASALDQQRARTPI